MTSICVYEFIFFGELNFSLTFETSGTYLECFSSLLQCSVLCLIFKHWNQFLFSDFSDLLFDLAPFFESFFNQTLGKSWFYVDFSVQVYNFLKCFGLLEIAETFRSSVNLPETQLFLNLVLLMNCNVLYTHYFSDTNLYYYYYCDHHHHYHYW